jgi:acetate kinase
MLDPKLNAEAKGREAVLSAPESAVKIMVIPTNEELVVAREVRRFLQTHSL